MEFYSVVLKDTKCGDIRYGRNYYDYREGTLVFTAPGQIMDIDNKGEYIQPMLFSRCQPCKANTLCGGGNLKQRLLKLLRN